MITSIEGRTPRNSADSADSPGRCDVRGRAMGTTFHMVLVCQKTSIGTTEREEVARTLVQRLRRLESLWSRFDPESEIGKLNAAPDRFHLVSADTVRLVETAKAGWLATGGSFDPTILCALEAQGYSDTLDACGGLHQQVGSLGAAPGCEGFLIDPAINMVCLSGARFDPGGIGKGLAADMLVDEALEGGALGAMVCIGGDILCRGQAPSADGWVIEVSEPSVADQRLALLGLRCGAVATSTTMKRQWQTTDGLRNHLIDPSTGHNTAGFLLATVIADSGWYAEALTKQLLVTSDLCHLDEAKAAALVVDGAGQTHTTSNWKEYTI